MEHAAVFLLLVILVCSQALPASIAKKPSQQQNELKPDGEEELLLETLSGDNRQNVQDSLKTVDKPKGKPFFCSRTTKNEPIGHNRTKRFSIRGNLWKIRNLDYRVSIYGRSLSKEMTDKTVERALKMWSDVAPLNFRRKDEGPVHIDIKFVTGDHGDGVPFDGDVNVLAHAFYPGNGGDVHFDDEVEWTLGIEEGVNFLQVSTHELGHSLGLEHSEDESAVMTEFYPGYKPDFRLQDDDIRGIRTLYGEGSRDDEGQTAALAADLCSDPTVDTVFEDDDGSVLIFKGNHFWRVSNKGASTADFPQRIGDKWPGLPGNIDGAFSTLKGKTYFFKKDQMWRYSGNNLDEFYPRLISEAFPGIPNDIDDAMYVARKVYFFKGSLVWVFNPQSKPPVSSIFPVKTSSFWDGVPSDIEAVIPTSTSIDFFKRGKFYEMDRKSKNVEAIRSAGYSWFGCKPQKIVEQHSSGTNRSEKIIPNEPKTT